MIASRWVSGRACRRVAVAGGGGAAAGAEAPSLAESGSLCRSTFFTLRPPRPAPPALQHCKPWIDSPAAESVRATKTPAATTAPRLPITRVSSRA